MGEIAEKYKDRKDLVIAKMDATENELDGIEIEGFPTLMMFKKETNERIDYVDKRKLDELVKFIETGEQVEAEEDDEDDWEDDEDDDDEEEEDDDDEDAAKTPVKEE